MQPKVAKMSVLRNNMAKKQSLSKQLYDSGYLWSYKATGDEAMLPDEELILNGLVHLEFEDMPMLFAAFPYRQIKSVWQRRMLPYPEYYGTLNLLLAALFFHIKSPPYPEYYGTLNLLLAALFFHIKSPKKYTSKYVA